MDVTIHTGNTISPENEGAALLCVAPVGQGTGKGPVGASLAPPAPSPLRECPDTWVELHLNPHRGSLQQPSGDS